MTIQSDTGYAFELPDDHAETIIGALPEDVRARVQDAIDATKEGDPVVLPVTVADVLLNTFSEWERTQP